MHGSIGISSVVLYVFGLQAMLIQLHQKTVHQSHSLLESTNILLPLLKPTFLHYSSHSHPDSHSNPHSDSHPTDALPNTLDLEINHIPDDLFAGAPRPPRIIGHPQRRLIMMFLMFHPHNIQLILRFLYLPLQPCNLFLASLFILLNFHIQTCQFLHSLLYLLLIFTKQHIRSPQLILQSLIPILQLNNPLRKSTNLILIDLRLTFTILSFSLLTQSQLFVLILKIQARFVLLIFIVILNLLFLSILDCCSRVTIHR